MSHVILCYTHISVKKKLIRIKRKPSIEEIDTYVSLIPPEFWTATRFIDYFFLLRHVHDSWTFAPTYSKENKIIIGHLLRSYDKTVLKRIFDGLFIFRRQLSTSSKMYNILTECGFLALGSGNLKPVLEKAGKLMQRQEAQEELPSYKRIPFEQWTEVEQQAFREAVNQGGFTYATGQATKE